MRASLVAVVAVLTVLALSPGAHAGSFTFDIVAAKAQQLAASSAREVGSSIPGWLGEISYDQWRDIRIRPEATLWREGRSPFQVQLFHPGMFYTRAVTINVVDAEGVHPVTFSPDQFDYGKNDFASRVPQDLGYAGLRIHYPVKRPDYYDEVIVFLGASYFRAVGKHEGYGASARGLAIDTALPEGEEFPAFTEYWLVRPAPNATELTVYALLESESLTGAYRFVVAPGERTIVKVAGRLYPRRPVRKLGLAPLTSMFLRGENTQRPVVDYRPEVHDSDGLLLQLASGEWLWRPLDNPEGLQVNQFAAPDLRGFGLLQYDRNFDHYQDLEARPDRRPSVWVTPEGDWGAGTVELVQIPTTTDVNDNIVAYWVPDSPLDGAGPFTFAYTMVWYGPERLRPPHGHAVATRVDHGNREDATRFVIDFASRELDAIPAETVLHGVVTADGSDERGEILEQQVVKNPMAGGWRLTFQVHSNGDAPLELRAFLEHRGRSLTETWTYTLGQ